MKEKHKMQTQEELPKVPVEVIAYLRKNLPEQKVDPTQPIEVIMFEAGKREVLRMLERLSKL